MGPEDGNWCYVKDNSCIHSKESVLSGDPRNWKTCSPCNCRGSWMYQGHEQMGCSTTHDWDQAWCYVQGHELNCDAADHSYNETEPLKWRNCMTCQCMNNWNYEGQVHHQCYEDMAWEGGTQWCYVDGYAHCHDAHKSEIEGEHRYYRRCADAGTCIGAKKTYQHNKCCGNPHNRFQLANDGKQKVCRTWQRPMF